MKTSIEVATKQEGEQIRTALSDPHVRAFVLVMGALQPLPSDRARARVLTWASDYADENAHAQCAAIPPPPSDDHA